MKTFALIALLLSTSSFAADAVTLTPGTKTINGVTLASGAVLTESHAPLAPIGAGLRTKKVVFVNVKVYVAELFSSNAATFDRTATGALNSVNQAGATTALTLSFVRGVGMSDILGAFEDGLNSNKVDQNNSDIQNFLNVVRAGGDAANNGKMTIVGERMADGDHIIFESTSGYQKEIIGKDGFVKDIFSIWLGNSADSGLASLKTDLLNAGTVTP